MEGNLEKMGWKNDKIRLVCQYHSCITSCSTKFKYISLFKFVRRSIKTMTQKQKKITEKRKEEEYQTPLEVLLHYLDVPHKTYKPIYLLVIEYRLSTPLIQDDASIAFLARKTEIEPTLMAGKIRSMVRMKWIEFEQVGNRDTNQIFVISPIWHYKSGVDKAKFAIALQQYKADIKEDKAHQMNTKEIYELMNSVCPHTGEKIDKDVCKSLRWEECKTCLYKLEEELKNEAT